MTPERLAAIKARLDSATPGPWGVIETTGEWFHIDCHLPDSLPVAKVHSVHSGYGNKGEPSANAALIANAPADLAALLAYVDELEGLLRDLCEDSRAAAEVVRLRKVVELGARAHRVAAAGTSNYDATLGLLMGAARAAHDALAQSAPTTKKPGGVIRRRRALMLRTDASAHPASCDRVAACGRDAVILRAGGGSRPATRPARRPAPAPPPSSAPGAPAPAW